jgi:arylformamidase
MKCFLSYPIDEKTPMYGGKKGLKVKKTSSIEEGDIANAEEWTMPNHLGTHIDFPNHFYDEGQKMEDVPQEYWKKYTNKEIQVIHVKLPEGENLVKKEHVINDKINEKAKILLIKTDDGKRRSNKSYWMENAGISLDFAKWIRKKFEKIRMIGIDSISISSWKCRDVGKQVHRHLLDPEKPILIIEDMDLKKITKKTKMEKIIIIPLQVYNSSGVPCTIMAEIKK